MVSLMKRLMEGAVGANNYSPLHFCVLYGFARVLWDDPVIEVANWKTQGELINIGNRQPSTDLASQLIGDFHMAGNRFHLSRMRIAPE